MANGQIRFSEITGSIHKVGREILKAPCNGWLTWYYINEETGNREPIDRIRKIMLEKMHLDGKPIIGINGGK